ncbi:MAG: hypothetical protein PHD81_03040 [Candidatus Nanoarchaeia archaeon]|nr:hypothetical protein [Candidatus Nanoarchaeia archaeon]MDD5588060.1 hypothetical protein [Candidatus Nanoarchaeia archaeon]
MKDDIKIIGDRTESKYDPNLAERLNKEVEEKIRRERLEGKKTELKPKQESPVTEPEIITPNDDSWLIESDKYAIQLSKSLIPSATQAKQINDYTTNPDSFKPANYPNIFLIGQMLYHNSHQQKDKILKFLTESFQNNWIQTSSGILYKSNGKDEIIHNIKMPSEYKHLTDLISSDGEVVQADEEALKYLTGLKSLDEIKEIAQFLTSKNKTYISRFNKKPDSDTYRVAWFYTNSDRAYLDCDWDPGHLYPALGVRIVAKKIVGN